MKLQAPRHIAIRPFICCLQIEYFNSRIARTC